MEGKQMVIFTIMLILWWTAGNCLAFDSTVAQDGSGNYQTIAEAIKAAPTNSSKSYFIRIKGGTYYENVSIPSDKTNIALVGDGIGVTTIVAHKGGRRFPMPSTATLEVYGSGFIGMKMTIINTVGANGGQSVALTTAPFNGYATYYQCRFEGYQDTILALAYAFFRDCEILGAVDFITGSGRTIFQNSAIIARKPIYGRLVRILAVGADNLTPYPGIVLQNCNIYPVAGFNKSDVKSYLGWPWKNYGKGIIMSSYISDFIDPQGYVWNPKVQHVYLAEYNNRGPGSNTAGRVKWSTVIDQNEASKYTVRIFLQGDNWIPKFVPHYLDLVEGPEYSV